MYGKYSCSLYFMYAVQSKMYCINMRGGWRGIFLHKKKSKKKKDFEISLSDCKFVFFNPLITFFLQGLAIYYFLQQKIVEGFLTSLA